jgi:hypothetical protein
VIDLGTVLSTGAGVLLGGLITWLVSRRFYVKAARDLTAETRRLRAGSNKILQALHAGGIKNPVRDTDTGEIEGFDLTVRLPPPEKRTQVFGPGDEAAKPQQ